MKRLTSLSLFLGLALFGACDRINQSEEQSMMEREEEMELERTEEQDVEETHEPAFDKSDLGTDELRINE